MTDKITSRLAAGAAAVCLVAAAASPARADGMREKLVGTWELVSLTTVLGDDIVEPFGPAPRGRQIIAPDGRFISLTARSSLPLVASANPMRATDEEYRAIGQGAQAVYGSYVVDEATSEIVFTVDVSTFPNLEGLRQRRVSIVDGDTWRYVNPTSATGGGYVEVVWKRLGPAAGTQTAAAALN
jgi:hypothetical protein